MRKLDERHFEVVTYDGKREVDRRPATTTEIWRIACGQPLSGFPAEAEAAKRVNSLYRQGVRARSQYARTG